MPILSIEGRDVEVSDNFLTLSPEEQHATVDHIAQSLGIKPSMAKQTGEQPQEAGSGFWNGVSNEAGKAAQAVGDIGRLMVKGAAMGKQATPEDAADRNAAMIGAGRRMAGGLGPKVEPTPLPEYQAQFDRDRKSLAEAEGRAGIAGSLAEIMGSMAPISAIAGGVGKAAQLASGLPLVGKIAANPYTQAAATGATYGAMEGAGTERGAGMGALMGAGLGVGAQGIASALTGAVSKAAGRFAEKPEIPTMQGLKDTSQAAYKRADAAGVIVKPEGMQRFANDAKEMLAENAYHPRMQKLMAPVVEEMERLSQGNITLKGLDTLRKMASDARMDQNPSTRRIAGKFVDKLDDFLDNMNMTDILTGNRTAGVTALREARSNWKTFRKAEMVDNAMEAAQLRAASSGSGGNLENTIRQEFRRIVNNPKKRSMFTPDEQDAMLQVVRGTSAQNLARLVGKLSPNGNGLALMLHTGAAVANPGGLIAQGAAAGAATAAKKFAEGAATRNAQRLSEIVRAGGSKAAASAPPNVVQRLADSERDTLARLLFGVEYNALASR